MREQVDDPCPVGVERQVRGQAIRGGVGKPRTNPYSFQGDTRSLDILMEASRRTGLPVVTEVMEPEHIGLALDAGVHVLQVGARNALNYSLLRQIGRAIASPWPANGPTSPRASTRRTSSSCWKPSASCGPSTTP